jgi:hypothetical protein
MRYLKYGSLMLGASALVMLMFLGAVTALAAIRAHAQVPPNDGRGPASEANTTLSCFESKRLVMRTWESPTEITSTDFVNIPGAGLNMVVPPGTDCIVVRFSGEFFGNSCLVHASLNGVNMPPGVRRVLFANNTGTEDHSVAWAQSVTVAAQTTFLVQIRARVLGPGQSCTIGLWQLEVDRRE